VDSIWCTITVVARSCRDSATSEASRAASTAKTSRVALVARVLDLGGETLDGPGEAPQRIATYTLPEMIFVSLCAGD
jgi:hypothetical protein